MSGKIMFKVLEMICDGAVDVADLTIAFLKVPYTGASVGSFEYQFKKLHVRRLADRERRELEKKAHQRFYNIVSRLKKDGLLKKEKGANGEFLKITLLGKKKLNALAKKNNDALPESRYQKLKGENYAIITFDIPERERRKRDWLRCVLRNLEFQLIQKSVWVGKTKIPEDFLNDLHEMNLTDHVEIFEISKKGTLRNLI